MCFVTSRPPCEVEIIGPILGKRNLGLIISLKSNHHQTVDKGFHLGSFLQGGWALTQGKDWKRP